MLKMVHVIWREMRKVMVEEETAYSSDTLLVMVGQYLWGNIQAHIVMYDLL